MAKLMKLNNQATKWRIFVITLVKNLITTTLIQFVEIELLSERKNGDSINSVSRHNIEKTKIKHEN